MMGFEGYLILIVIGVVVAVVNLVINRGRKDKSQ